MRRTFLHALRFARAVHPFIATWGTMLVSLLLLPLVDIIFSVHFGYRLSDVALAEMIIAAMLTTTMISAINGAAQTVVRDYNLGILTHVLTVHPTSITYWSYAIGLPAILACIPHIIGLIFWIFFSSHLFYLLGGVSSVILIILFVCAAGIGAFMGAFIALISTLKKNPYVYTNILVSFFPLLVGTFLPLSAYPQIFQHIASLIPGSGLVVWGRMLVQGTESLGPCVQTITSSIVWIVMLLLLFRRHMMRIRHGVSHGMI